MVHAGDGGESAITLRSDEQVHAKLQANHIVGRVGFEGNIYLTSERLVFVPWPASRSRGGVSFEFALADISAADVAPRGSRYSEWRRRLRIRRSSGEVDLFVVWRPEKAAELVQESIRGAAN